MPVFSERRGRNFGAAAINHETPALHVLQP
jgi:hypothetical protein